MSNRITYRWTPARTGMLMRMWGAGATASEIAREIGDGMTRDGVLGKVHRLGLAKHQAGCPFGPPMKSFNFFLTENQAEWLRKTFGHKRMSAGVRSMLDEAMHNSAAEVKVEKARNVVSLPEIPKRMESSIPWPDKQRLMAGR